LPHRAVDACLLVRITGAVLEESARPGPWARTRPLSVGELELDDPSPGEVLVQIAAAGVCHSDLSVVDGNRPRPVPMLLGHEASGRVAALGHGVSDLAVGQQVVMTFLPRCGRCPGCATGGRMPCGPGTVSNASGELLGGGRRLTRDGIRVHHHLGVSAFATHAVVAVDGVAAKRERALELGATASLDPAELESRAVRCDVVVEAAGSARAFEAALAATAPGGRTVTVGLPHPDARASVSPLQLVAEARTVIGSYLGSAVPSRDIPVFTRWWREGRLPVEALVSSRITLDDVNEAMDRLATGSALRQVIEF
jgi:alcohol dehydrogenase